MVGVKPEAAIGHTALRPRQTPVHRSESGHAFARRSFIWPVLPLSRWRFGVTLATMVQRRKRTQKWAERRRLQRAAVKTAAA